jgi:hypothetical protein
MDQHEQEILECLDKTVWQGSVTNAVDEIAIRVEQKLTMSPSELLAWESVPLSIYEIVLPEEIKSSWVFVLRAGGSTGAERHPNSHQRVMSYRGDADLQTCSHENPRAEWNSNFLRSDLQFSWERRWLSIPPGVWHQAVIPAGTNWIVVSFHTVYADELIEERPDPEISGWFRQRRYVGSDQH